MELQVLQESATFRYSRYFRVQGDSSGTVGYIRMQVLMELQVLQVKVQLQVTAGTSGEFRESGISATSGTAGHRWEEMDSGVEPSGTALTSGAVATTSGTAGSSGCKCFIRTAGTSGASANFRYLQGTQVRKVRYKWNLQVHLSRYKRTAGTSGCHQKIRYKWNIQGTSVATSGTAGHQVQVLHSGTAGTSGARCHKWTCRYFRREWQLQEQQVLQVKLEPGVRNVLLQEHWASGAVQANRNSRCTDQGLKVALQVEQQVHQVAEFKWNRSRHKWYSRNIQEQQFIQVLQVQFWRKCPSNGTAGYSGRQIFRNCGYIRSKLLQMVLQVHQVGQATIQVLQEHPGISGKSGSNGTAGNIR